MKHTYENCTVPLLTLQSNGGFTKDNLTVHNILCSDKAETGLFDNAILESKYGLKYIRRNLIPIRDIDTNDIYGQSVRDGVNPARDQIKESIEFEGFKLKEFAPCAYQNNQGKWIILEGRTRISILRDLNITGNLLINEYQKVDESIDDAVFGLHCNGDIGSPKGEASQNDLIRFFQNLVANGDIEFDNTINQDKARLNFKKEVKKFAKEKFTKLKISGPSVDSILDYAMKNKGTKPNIRPFNSREEAMRHCNAVLGIRDDDKFVYVVTTTDEWGFFKDVLPVWRNMQSMSDFRTIRVIVTKMAPSSVADWYLANIRVGRKMESHINEALLCWGGGTKANNPGIEIYGTIPQCVSESGKYPMDKLILYKDIDNTTYDLYGN